MDAFALSKRFGVNAEAGEYPVFLSRIRGKRVLVLCDRNTRPLADGILEKMANGGGKCTVLAYPEEEPVADEKTVACALSRAEDSDYLLAVGAGTLNDVAKRAATLCDKPCGVFATAPSMDGYTSGVTPLIENGRKITRPSRVAEDVLLDYSVLCAAPRILIGAGAGDVLAKRCALADWRLSHALTGEAYNLEAAEMMGEAVAACEESIPDLMYGREEGVRRLMDALLISGYAMVVAGSSRPASGAEHHMSHFLETDFLRRGKRIPPHGVKVGLGTAVSAYLYHTLQARAPFAGCEAAYAVAESVPRPQEILSVLYSLGCPTRFSELGVSEDTVRDMLRNAYLIRDRFTILTLYCTRGLMEGAEDELIAKFY